jgi:hypothetical protein
MGRVSAAAMRSERIQRLTIVKDVSVRVLSAVNDGEVPPKHSGPPSGGSADLNGA